jgi:hypothetical protein
VLETPLLPQLNSMLAASARRPRALIDLKRILLTMFVQRLALATAVLALVVNVLRHTLLHDGARMYALGAAGG